MKKTVLLAALLPLVVLPRLAADEGMWQPHQLPALAAELEAKGLELPPESLTDLLGHPMNAVISLGGCTASFVSPQGLVVTNHHCVYRALQHNSTEEKNLLVDGFLARDPSEEIAAGPGSRVLVTVEVRDVTEPMREGLDELEGRARFQLIEKRDKEMVAECEKDEGHRCRVAAFYGGLRYFLVKQLEIRDVRLVYAPKGSVGKYGGEVDNWMWPRHTGDFSFYRAYVGKDGLPADPSEENVPYKPRHYLTVSAEGVKPGDYVMVVGYPGGTDRYRLAVEVESQFEWTYPTMRRLFDQWLDIIEETTRDRPDDAIKYAGTVAGLSNSAKNFGGMIAGYEKSDVVARKHRLETELGRWIAADPERGRRYASVLSELEALIAEERSFRERGMYYEFMAQSAALLEAAENLYRLSLEKEKPDAERKPGFQERDLRRIRERLERIDRTFSPDVDRVLWRRALLEYAATPKDQHVAAFDAWFGIDGNGVDEAVLDAKLDEMYAKTELGDAEKRLAWLDAGRDAFESSEDPFIRLAVALYPSNLELEEEDEDRDGRFDALRPAFMEAMIAFLGSQGRAVYPDANRTLRVTYGTVQGYSPRDALTYMPLTTTRGLLEKETGEDPFDSPPELLEAIRDKRFGRYGDEDLGGVAVNFLSNVDTTGGNSGSPTLNGRGELVGLLFDGNWESIIADWDFLPDVTRSIHADVRYMLWVMDHVDGADHLIREMGLEPDPEPAP